MSGGQGFLGIVLASVFSEVIESHGKESFGVCNIFAVFTKRRIYGPILFKSKAEIKPCSRTAFLFFNEKKKKIFFHLTIHRRAMHIS